MKTGVILVTVLILIGGVAANYLRYVESQPDRPPTFDVIPMQESGYQGEERRFSRQSYEVLKADTSTLRVYSDPGGSPIWMFIGYFESQKYGSQIHSPKHCLPGGGWKITHLESYLLELSDGTSRDVNRVLATERGQHHVMFYWFETRSGSIRSEFGLKWDLMLNSLLGRPTDAAMVRINLSLVGGEDVEAGTARTLAFLETFLPAMERSLPFGSQ